MSERTCAVLIYDAKATRAAPRSGIVIRPCGAKARYTVNIGGDTLFAVCHRHDDRLRRDGVRIAGHAG